eukprot:Plantae.Rhodophyta-Purpureofilum_apyrenoidigerum.ctg17232.p1 GENE.Plantae.Rhodophyta-Purpureofilum_apyrenoidigerum.ctg17232~~Plantae.Rhodophyta-Purpureofilum_apyrenoidigerum.ctg17232.p1  ORF type:complete len:513 (+),score=103.44 Plantae.Rhodophyta-Purpureofilum_apyrenoidigerum.ctg17232:120-1658(+)
MFCSLSGVTPEEPVVNKKTGHIYEKRLIEQHILASGGKDPETEEELTENDLVSIKISGSVVQPLPSSTASIPGLLSHMKNEWDAVMLETFKLKKSLKATRMELSQSLYYYDAALRVIARLTNERDEARKTLEELRDKENLPSDKQEVTVDGQQMNGNPGGEAEDVMEVDAKTDGEATLNPEVVEKITAKSDELVRWRKKRPAIDGLFGPADIGKFEKKTSVGKAGSAINTVRASRGTEEDGQIIVSANAAGKVTVMNMDGEIQTSFKAHSKPVLDICVNAAGGSVVTASADSTVKIWKKSIEGSFKKGATISAHSKDVMGCTLHATESYFLTCSLDASWGLHDFESAKTLVKKSDPDGMAFKSVEFHPDGALFATGLENGTIRIWDIRTSANEVNFDTDTGSDVSSVVLSENGYYLASVSGNERVQLWDLRKLKAHKTLNVEKDDGICLARFDLSGNYIAFAGSNSMKVYDVKKWKELLSVSGQHYASLAWNRQASSLFCGSREGTVAIYGK